MKRHLFNLTAGLSLLLCAAVCVLWVRTWTGSDQVAWTYDRYLPDRSAASSQVYLTSDRRRLWLDVNRGHVGPYNGQLVWGYYVNADQSGGRPQLRYDRRTYDGTDRMMWALTNGNDATPGVGPLRWSFVRRAPPKDGDTSVGLRLGASHWLAALVLLVPPMLWLRRFRRERRARMVGRCAGCGYDLRATPDRCPECGRRSTPAAAPTAAAG
jgi:hypothetical protein